MQKLCKQYNLFLKGYTKEHFESFNSVQMLKLEEQQFLGEASCLLSEVCCLLIYNFGWYNSWEKITYWDQLIGFCGLLWIQNFDALRSLKIFILFTFGFAARIVSAVPAKDGIYNKKPGCIVAIWWIIKNIYKQDEIRSV